MPRSHVLNLRSTSGHNVFYMRNDVSKEISRFRLPSSGRRRLLLKVPNITLALGEVGWPTYRIYSNKRRGAYLIFRASSAALIRGRRLFKNCTRQIYFFYIFIQRYTFYLLISLWTDTKLIVNLELRKKFKREKNPESFMITRAKL